MRELGWGGTCLGHPSKHWEPGVGFPALVGVRYQPMGTIYPRRNGLIAQPADWPWS
jgi:hypothetical protein